MTAKETFQDMTRRGANVIQKTPKKVRWGLLFLIVLAIVIGIGFIPGKVGFLRRLIKMEGASCGNDENAESQEYNEEKECITTCKDGFELTRDENDKDTCSKIPDTNCVVSEFGACSLEGENCVKKRSVQTYPSGDGTGCPSLTEDCDPSECQSGPLDGEEEEEEEVIPPPSWCPVGYALKNDHTQTCYETKKELCSAKGLGTDGECSGNLLKCEPNNTLLLHDNSKVKCCKPVYKPTWSNPTRMTCDARY